MGSLPLQPLPGGERPASLACTLAAHLHFFQHFEEFRRLKKKRRKSPVRLKETRGEPAQAPSRQGHRAAHPVPGTLALPLTRNGKKRPCP